LASEKEKKKADRRTSRTGRVTGSNPIFALFIGSFAGWFFVPTKPDIGLVPDSNSSTGQSNFNNPMSNIAHVNVIKNSYFY
jgi:hypothetical protein